MPEIARFYGIVIKLYFGDHPPPHFHVSYGEYVAVFDIVSLKVREGRLPSRARNLVLEWARMHRMEMLQMWKTQTFQKLTPLE